MLRHVNSRTPVGVSDPSLQLAIPKASIPPPAAPRKHLPGTWGGKGAGKAPYPKACVCLGSDPPSWDVHRDMADDGLLKI